MVLQNERDSVSVSGCAKCIISELIYLIFLFFLCYHMQNYFMEAIMINQWYGLDILLECLDDLDEKIDNRYKLRSELIPAWKNFLKNHVDAFNRYPEMVDHGSYHVSNVLGLLAEWLLPKFETIDNDKKFTNKKTAKAGTINAEELFILIAAIFLHDIGMSYLDNDETAAADLDKTLDDIRTQHGNYSRQMMKKYKYRDTNIVNGLKPEQIEAIGLVCKHHQKKAAIFEEDYEILMSQELKKIKDDRKASSNDKQKKRAEIKSEIAKLKEEKSSLNIIIKSSPGLSRYISENNVDLCLLASLIRILDAADIQYSRAGSIWLTKLKKQRNENLKSENAAIRDQIPPENNKIRNFFDKKIKYFDKQIEHYIKHSFFEKSWIIGDKIVFKPIDKDQYEELCIVEKQFIHEKYEVEKNKKITEVTSYINEELELVRAYIKKVRPQWNITGIDCYSREKHFNDIGSLKHFSDYITVDEYIRDNNIISGDIVEGLRDRIIRSIATERVRAVYVIGPAKSAKTYMLSSVCKKLEEENGKLFDGIMIFKLPKTTKKIVSKGLRSTFIDNFILSASSFLADQCNFWFFNRLRTANEVEKSTWEKLFNQIEKGRYLICFDDFNNLPNLDKNSREYDFLNQLFKKTCNTKLLVFSTQIPVNYFDERVSDVHKMNFDELLVDRRAERFVDDFIKRKLNRDEIKKINAHPDVKKGMHELVKKFNDFPAVVFTRFKDDIGYYLAKSDFSGMIEYFDQSISRQLYPEVFLKLGNDYQKKIINYFVQNSVFSQFDLDPRVLAREIFFDQKTGEETITRIAEAVEELKRRKLIFKLPEEKHWRIDRWWKNILM